MVLEKLLDRWEEMRVSFINKHGFPGSMKQKVSVWEQFFDKGSISYFINGDNVIIFSEGKKFSIHPRPTSLITSGQNNCEVNATLLLDLIKTFTSKEKEVYQRLLNDCEIQGGIGTIYVKNNLLNRLGYPKANEQFASHAFYIEGPIYNLLAGVSNNVRVDKGDPWALAIYIMLKSTNTYKKDAIPLSNLFN